MILLLILKLSVMVLLFGIGLGSTPADLTYLWRRPKQLLRAVLAMYLAVPVAAVILVKALPLPIAVETAMLVLSISAGAPLLPRKLMKLGREDYAFSLDVASSVLAVVTVPAWLMVLDPVFGREASASPSAVALVIAKGFLAPLLLGMLLRGLLSDVAGRLAPWILRVGGAVLALTGVALLALQAHLIVQVGWTTLLALAGFTIVALAVGHALGGPDPGDRSALAVSCASRNLGVAILAASATPQPGALAFVLTYFLASALVTIPYRKWRGRSAAGAVQA